MVDTRKPTHTRKRNHAGNIRKRGNSFEGSVMVGGRRITFTAKSEAEAKTRITQIVQTAKTSFGLNGNYKLSAATVQELAKEWLGTLSDLASRTRGGYERDMYNYILPAFSTRLMSSITTADVQKFVEELKQEIGPKTIKNIVSVFSTFLGYGVRNNLFLVNPADGVKLPKAHNRAGGDPDLSGQVMGDDYIFFVNLLQRERDPYKDVYYFGINTAMRHCEMIGLTWDRVNFENHSIRIDRQYMLDRETGKYIFAPVKYKYARTIYGFSQKVFDRLRMIKDEQDKKIESGKLKNDIGFVFLGNDDTHIKSTTLNEKFREFISLHPEFPQNMRIHDLRGSFATHAFEIGVPAKVVSFILGHRNVEFTINHYMTASMRAQLTSAQMQDDDLDKFRDMLDREDIKAKMKDVIMERSKNYENESL